MQRSSIPAGTPGKEGGEPQQHLIVAAANDDETTTGTTKTTEGDGDSSRRWSSWWPATAFEAMRGSSPPTFPPDVQCGIDICNNSGHNRAYLFTGDECLDLYLPQNDIDLTACYVEYHWDCHNIWNDLDDPQNYHITSGEFARSALVRCIMCCSFSSYSYC